MASLSSMQPQTIQHDSDSVALLQLLQSLQQQTQSPSMDSLIEDSLLSVLQSALQNQSPPLQEQHQPNQLNQEQATKQQILPENLIQGLKSSTQKQSSILSSSSASSASMQETGIPISQPIITTDHPINQCLSPSQNTTNEADILNFFQSYLALEQLMQVATQSPQQPAAFVETQHYPQGEWGQDSADENFKSKTQPSHLLSTPSNLDKIQGNSNIKPTSLSTVSQKTVLNSVQNNNSNSNESFNTPTMLSSNKKGFSRHQNTSSFIPRIITYEGHNSNNINQNINNLDKNTLNQQIDTQNQSNILTQDNFFNSMDPSTVLSLSAFLAQQGEVAMAAVAALSASDLLRQQEQKRLERQYKIERYKNKRRNWIRKISYDCRKRVADSRLRVKGRFISKKDTQKIKTTDDSSFPIQDNQHPSDVADSNNNNMEILPSIYYDCPVQTIPNLKQSSIPDKPTQDEAALLPHSASSCELTCAASSNFSISLKPETMDKIKQRISKKKTIFKLSSASSISIMAPQYLQNIPSATLSSSSTVSIVAERIEPS